VGVSSLLRKGFLKYPFERKCKLTDYWYYWTPHIPLQRFCEAIHSIHAPAMVHITSDSILSFPVFLQCLLEPDTPPLLK